MLAGAVVASERPRGGKKGQRASRYAKTQEEGKERRIFINKSLRREIREKTSEGD